MNETQNKKPGRKNKNLIWPTTAQFTINDIINMQPEGTIKPLSISGKVKKALDSNTLIKVGKLKSNTKGRPSTLYSFVKNDNA